MLFGLAIGLVVAAGVYFRNAPPATPAAAAVRPAQRSESAPASATPAATAPAATAPASNARAKSAAQPAAPAESRFDFYEMLPQFEVVVPEVETAASPAVRARPVQEPGSYILQAGSFSSHADADRLQANLALLGIEARIQRVTIDDDVFHRVRIGPITNLDALNRTRKQLRDAGIDPMLMKVP
jgi:cell division protein FtsN